MKKINSILVFLVLVSPALADNWVLLYKGETVLTNDPPNNVRLVDVKIRDDFMDYLKAGNPSPSQFPSLVNTDTGIMSVKPTTIAAGKQECKDKWDGGKSNAEIWATDQYQITCSNLCVLAGSPVKSSMKAAVQNARSVDSNAGWKLLNQITALRVLIDREREAAGRNRPGANDDGKDE